MKSFLKEALSSIKTTGTIRPSSRYLVNEILKRSDFDKARVIIEFGPGDGVITEQIVQRMHKDAKLIVFEINDAFYEHCQTKFKNDTRVEVLKASAFDINKILADRGVEQVDEIISSLPMSLFDKSDLQALLKDISHIMAEKSLFVQYQYSLGKYFLLKEYFESVRIGFTPRNLPPAFVYYCS